MDRFYRSVEIVFLVQDFIFQYVFIWESTLGYTVIASIPTAPLRVAAMVENEHPLHRHRERSVAISWLKS
ncbi:MAG: hypothetical protein ACYTGH_19240, partial [Planctomycetota bacterium]